MQTAPLSSAWGSGYTPLQHKAVTEFIPIDTYGASRGKSYRDRTALAAFLKMGGGRTFWNFEAARGPIGALYESFGLQGLSAA